MDWHAAAKFGVDLPGQINQLGIDRCWFLLAPIAQDPVDAFQCVRLISTVTFVNDTQGLFGMNAIKCDPALAIALGLNRGG